MAFTHIQKFPFAGSSVSASTVSALSYARRGCAGVSSSDHGHIMGGWTGSALSGAMDKFAFASDGDGASGTGNMSATRYGCGGSEDSTHGYISGGGPTTTVDRVTFASDANSVDNRDLAISTAECCATSSATNAYVMGNSQHLDNTKIEKFAFANTNTAVDTANMSTAHTYGIPFHSTIAGYCAGANQFVATTDKFFFASDTSVAAVGNLTVTRGQGSGHQSQTVTG